MRDVGNVRHREKIKYDDHHIVTSHTPCHPLPSCTPASACHPWPHALAPGSAPRLRPGVPVLWRPRTRWPSAACRRPRILVLRADSRLPVLAFRWPCAPVDGGVEDGGSAPTWTARCPSHAAIRNVPALVPLLDAVQRPHRGPEPRRRRIHVDPDDVLSLPGSDGRGNNGRQLPRGRATDAGAGPLPQMGCAGQRRALGCRWGRGAAGEAGCL